MRTAALLAIGCVFFAAATRADDPPKAEKSFDFTGRTEASVQVEMRARVTGYLTRNLVDIGDSVKAGDVIAELDSRPYKAIHDTAKAKVTRAEAHAKLADVKVARTKNLVDKGAGTKEEYDEAIADREVAVAEVHVAKAELEVAALNLSFTKLVTPISGVVSRRFLDAGNLVQADTTTIVTIVQVDPVFVTFDVDERSLSKLLDAKGKLAVAVGFPGDEGYPHTAEFQGIGTVVNPDTGTAQVRAKLANPKGKFLPGMFVRVRVTPQPGK